uniref:Methyltransferase domain-containing protein n=1 Tax=Chrysotila carterae TaxID=13221 RepID=A0A6S9TFU8_CHRCT
MAVPFLMSGYSRSMSRQVTLLSFTQGIGMCLGCRTHSSQLTWLVGGGCLRNSWHIAVTTAIPPPPVSFCAQAGTGLMLGHLSRAVGESGKVLAIDVSQRFVGFMEQRVKRNKLPNVRVSKCSPKSADLADYAGKVDLAIIIDVYHHFEYPRTFMRSLHTVLRDGGRVVVCDFHRDPAKMVHHKPEWAIEHIRADQQTFRQEIESAGFELVDSAEVQELVENYVMVFQSSSK